VKATLDQPSLGFPEAYYWDRYCQLSAYRSGELQPQPISIPDIAAYCDLLGITAPSIRENMLDAVTILEAESRRLRTEDNEASNA